MSLKVDFQLDELKQRHREETKPILTLLKTADYEVRLNEKCEASGLSIDHLRLG